MNALERLCLDFGKECNEDFRAPGRMDGEVKY